VKLTGELLRKGLLLVRLPLVEVTDRCIKN
jgi:hypothetical protein